MNCEHKLRNRVVFSLAYFVTLPSATPNLLRLGRKNKCICFVLLSTFRNFAAEKNYGAIMNKRHLTGLSFFMCMLTVGVALACRQNSTQEAEAIATDREAATLLNSAVSPPKSGESGGYGGTEVRGYGGERREAIASKERLGSEATGGRITRYELPAALKDRPEKIIRRSGYTTSYNSSTKCPNWVAWHLTKNHTYGKVQRYNEKFSEDTSVGSSRATDWDYYNSRYDRGHMCPAGDNKWDSTAMTETFLFTNICPQNHALNKYEWNDLEIRCRDWARRYGAVDIVCGPVYYADVEPRYIGRNKVRVPDAFFKVVLCRQGNGKAIGFLYKNDGKKVKMADAVYTVDQIESLTGIDFFPQLDDKIENRVEAEAELAVW